MHARTVPVHDHVIASLQAGDYAALTQCYANDALLDVNMSTWRFQLQGPAAARAYFTEELGSFANLRCTQLRALACDEAIIVETECRFERADGECLTRALDVVRVLGEKIVEHTRYCSGTWSPDDIARQSSEAPMLRW